MPPCSQVKPSIRLVEDERSIARFIELERSYHLGFEPEVGHAESKVPKASFFLSACTHIGGKMYLRQTRCADMPDAANPLAGGLTWGRIS
jgi:hypothetical protein